MERAICIHGHFYQPPRENPWLEAVEIQDSAHPYHDWNERITAECYAPNAASRLLDAQQRITDIISNYARISFNFGPTLLSWLESFAPDVYAAIIAADRQSIAWRSGHGSAMAQVYNHIIMPLANSRDRHTQVTWGIKDFKKRFNRIPEGMWLAETAVDIESLEILAQHGIVFTVLAPRQAAQVRKIGSGRWKDVSGGRIDPTRAYLCRLPSGRKIDIFFYDGPISQDVAFENLLKRGELFAHRILSGFSDQRNWSQLVNLATDGETYGHHHRFGDMALTYALRYIEAHGEQRLTNYSEFLGKYPPTHEVQIFENSSWSCVHGIERWRADCGCNSGGHGDWNQAWRKPLRDALDWLRDHAAVLFEKKAAEFLKDPWEARNAYISVMLDRSTESVDRYFAEHAFRQLSVEERVTVMKLMEMQRHALLMYTSCGWFFDELSGLETIQVLQYAGRVVQLAEELFGTQIESVFKVHLTKAMSNLPECGNGSLIYDEFVKPAMIDLKRVAVHYAVSSVFEEYGGETDIYSYRVRRLDTHQLRAGRTRLAIGKIEVSSRITLESDLITYCVIHMGEHALNGGVRTYLGQEAYEKMKEEISRAFERGEFAEIIHLMDAHFGMHTYSLVDLFRDQQRRILNLLIGKTIEEFSDTYKQMYEYNRTMMGFLRETGMPVPKAFLTAAEFTFNAELRRAFQAVPVDLDRVQTIVREVANWSTTVEPIELEFIVRHCIENMMQELGRDGSDISLLIALQRVMELVQLLPFEINYWYVQNIYHRLSQSRYQTMVALAATGDPDSAKWVGAFKYLGEMLFFNINAVLDGTTEVRA